MAICDRAWVTVAAGLEEAQGQRSVSQARLKAERVLLGRPSEDRGDTSPFPDRILFCPLAVVPSQLYYRKLWSSKLITSVWALCTYAEVAVSSFLLGTSVLPDKDINQDS